MSIQLHAQLSLRLQVAVPQKIKSVCGESDRSTKLEDGFYDYEVLGASTTCRYSYCLSSSQSYSKTGSIHPSNAVGKNEMPHGQPCEGTRGLVLVALLRLDRSSTVQYTHMYLGSHLLPLQLVDRGPEEYLCNHCVLQLCWVASTMDVYHLEQTRCRFCTCFVAFGVSRTRA